MWDGGGGCLLLVGSWWSIGSLGRGGGQRFRGKMVLEVGA